MGEPPRKEYTIGRGNFIVAATLDDEQAANDGIDTLADFIPKQKVIQFIKQKALFSTCVSLIVQLFLLFHAPVSAKAFYYFDCHRLGQNKYLLRRDYSLECYGPRYNEYLPFAYLLLFGFAFMVPVSISIFLFNHRRNLHSPSTRAKIGFLYQGYMPGVEFWEVHEVLRKTLLTGLLIYMPPNMRSPSAVVVCLVACCSLNYFRPHRNRIVFWIAEASFLLTTAKYLVTIYGMSLGGEITLQEQQYLGYLLISLDMTIIFGGWICVVAVVFLMRKSIHKIHLNEIERQKKLHLKTKVVPINRQNSVLSALYNKKNRTKMYKKGGMTVVQGEETEDDISSKEEGENSQDFLEWQKQKEMNDGLTPTDVRSWKSPPVLMEESKQQQEQKQEFDNTVSNSEEHLNAVHGLLFGGEDSDSEPDMETLPKKDPLPAIRKVLLEKLKTPKRLAKIFKKLDKEKKKGLSKIEFRKLVFSICVKSGYGITQENFVLLWLLLEHDKTAAGKEIITKAVFEKWLFAGSVDKRSGSQRTASGLSRSDSVLEKNFFDVDSEEDDAAEKKVAVVRVEKSGSQRTASGLSRSNSVLEKNFFDVDSDEDDAEVEEVAVVHVGRRRGSQRTDLSRSNSALHI